MRVTGKPRSRSHPCAVRTLTPRYDAISFHEHNSCTDDEGAATTHDPQEQALTSLGGGTAPPGCNSGSGAQDVLTDSLVARLHDPMPMLCPPRSRRGGTPGTGKKSHQDRSANANTDRKST